MTAHIWSATPIGFTGKLIDVECDTSNSLPGLVIVGLGNKAIDEAKERVKSAIKNSGFDFPRKRITINLAPANLPKDGAHFDLPIAIAILCVSKQLPFENLKEVLLVGELSLDGSLRPTRGAINFAEVAKDNAIRTIILPTQNAEQAALVDSISVIGASNLKEVVLHLKNEAILQPKNHTTLAPTPPSTRALDEVYGQEQAKRALLIAAAGHHNILFNGPPGSGKTMLAKALAALLPPLSAEEMIETTKLHNLAMDAEIILTKRPFRSPHHSASHVSLVGGGKNPLPGEISLAHKGVLFLDELPEYSRASLEALRQPLEDKIVHIARAQGHVSYPADFMLVATQNPCPCGFATDPSKECTCSAFQIMQYQKKVSGPLLDRIDMSLEVSRVDHDKLLSNNQTSNSTDVLTQLQKAQEAQQKRFNDNRKNAHLTSNEITELALLSTAAHELINQANQRLQLSARSFFKVIRVARTIADLEGHEYIEASDISEALQYRRRTS